MATNPRNYASDTQLGTSVVDIISQVAAATNANPSKLSFYNSNTTTARTVTVHVVESGGTADTGNTLVQKSIPPLKTWNVVEIQGEVLAAGMKLQASQGVGEDVNANCAGSDIT